MRGAGLQGAKRRGKPWRTTVCDPAAVRAPDLVERDFSASRPDELWVCDFAYGRCWEGVVYLAFVKDAYSRMIVGWQFRKDKVDKTGRVTLRHLSRLHHIAVGRAHKGRAVTILVADLDIRVIDDQGELIRALTLDPSRNYQPLAPT